MTRKKRKQKPLARPKRPLLTTWPVVPGIPTYDFLAQYNLDDPGAIEWVWGDFLDLIEAGDFLRWEALISQEQGLPLTKKQQKAVDELQHLISEPGERVLYIDEVPRPQEPWYEIARKLAPLLVKEPFDTSEIMYAVHTEGWPDLVEALAEYGPHFSLPEGVESPLDIFSVELRHKLWLQTCFDVLSGLGQEAGLTLAEEEQDYRIVWFVHLLKEHRDTVAYFALTLETLLQRVILPPQDRPLFIQMMTGELGLPSSQAPLEKYLS